MGSGKIASWAYAEQFLPDNVVAREDVLDQARARGSELGVSPVLPGAGAYLRTCVAMTGARAVIEVGTGVGVGTLYILSALPASGVVTSIDAELENHRVARENFALAGVDSSRVRLIAGQASHVLERLTARAYDMIVISAEHPEIDELTDVAIRVLRPGGTLLVMNALFHDRVADPVRRDVTTSRIRDLVQRLAERRELVCSLTPSGDGVLTAVVRH